MTRLLILAELRKLAHPFVIVALLSAAGLAVVLQIGQLEDELAFNEVLAPNPGDLVGAATIAVLYATSLPGWILAALVAAMGTAGEYSERTIDYVGTLVGRRNRFVLAKGIAAIGVLALLAVVVFVFVATYGLLAQDEVREAATHNPFSAFASTALSGSAIALMMVALALAAALLTRSEVTTVVLVVGFICLTLPLADIAPVNVLTLPYWITSAMEYDANGAMSDFIWSSSAARASRAAGVLVCGGVAGAALIAAWRASRRDLM